MAPGSNSKLTILVRDEFHTTALATAPKQMLGLRGEVRQPAFLGLPKLVEFVQPVLGTVGIVLFDQTWSLDAPVFPVGSCHD